MEKSPSVKAQAQHPATQSMESGLSMLGLGGEQGLQLKATANGSAQVNQLRSLQAAANGSAHMRQLQAQQFAANPVQQRENKTGMPDQLKSGIEGLSGMFMEDVKVHYNSSKPAQLQAHAYAQGTDIHIAPGQERHLPHEAWHVVQQKQGSVKPTLQLKGVAINDDSDLEREADVMGARAMGGIDHPNAVRNNVQSHNILASSRSSVGMMVLQGKFKVGQKWYSPEEWLKDDPTFLNPFRGGDKALKKMSDEEMKFDTFSKFSETFIATWLELDRAEADAARAKKEAEREQLKQAQALQVKSVTNSAAFFISKVFPSQGKADFKADIQILSDLQFNNAFIDDCLSRLSEPMDGPKLEMLKLKLWSDAEKANGFHSSKHVSYIRASNVNLLETAIHELSHHIMSHNILHSLGFSINEGVTEYLATKVYVYAGVKVGERPYGMNKMLIEHLIRNGLKEADLYKAAFEGDTGALEKALRVLAKEHYDTLIYYSKRGLDQFSQIVLKILSGD